MKHSRKNHCQEGHSHFAVQCCEVVRECASAITQPEHRLLYALQEYLLSGAIATLEGQPRMKGVLQHTC